MKIKPLPLVSLATFGISVFSFVIMRTYESHAAGWSAVIFGFAAIATMMVSGLKKLGNSKASRLQK